MEHETRGSYEQYMNQGDKALTARKVEEALTSFTQAVELADKNTERYINAKQMVALCKSMLEQHEDALILLTQLNEVAANLNNEQLQSNVLRDLVLAIRRDPHGDTALAHEKLDEAFARNADENNKWALTGIRGRLFMKEGKIEEALTAHQQADTSWEAMRSTDTPPNDQWQFNNLIPYYEAAKANGKVELAADLYERIISDPLRFTAKHQEKLDKINAKY